MTGINNDNFEDAIPIAGGGATFMNHTKLVMSSSQEKAAIMPIAIVGMACRLPGGVNNTDDLWQLCALARSAWSEMPPDRFKHEDYYHPDAGRLGTYNAKGGYFLQGDVGLFDAAFFNITAKEAVALDPQQRLLLECSYEALENGGITKHSIAGTNTGVYIGASTVDYQHHCFKDIRTTPMYTGTGCQPSLLSNRLSHYYNLKGPSLTVDTMCSSSLNALHMACQSLRSGEITQAIVGSAHLNLSADQFVSLSNQRWAVSDNEFKQVLIVIRLFGSEGRCFTFDHRASSGYGRGEGVGCIVIKPLHDALAARDLIRAVILNTGANQDGCTDGIGVPNQRAQEDLIRSVYSTAGLDTKDTGFVEAHGTGTKVGDPIEAAAIHAVFGKGRSPQQPLLVGSVKSNIGHLEAASGIISIIKAALILEKGFTLPNFDFQLPNPSIPMKEWNIKVPTDQRPWPRSKRFVSVNNFGLGGANCHAVLEKAPRLSQPGPPPSYKSVITETGTVTTEIVPNSVRPWMQHLYVLTANDRKSLEDQIRSLGLYLETQPELFRGLLMRMLAYTLCERRSFFPWRIATSACTAVELSQKLTNSDQLPKRTTKKPSVGFVFTGQGAQWHAMGRELMAAYPVFAATVGATANELSKDVDTSCMDLAYISQPACTALQLALTDLLKSWNIQPAAVVGHSSGEIAASYAAGALSIESCMKIAYFRGQVMSAFKSKCPQLHGAMLAVGCDENELKPHLENLKTGKVVLAAINSPASLTVSGDEDAILELQQLLEQRSIFNRKLRVDVAYHSHHMELVAQEYLDLLVGIAPVEIRDVRFCSTVTGTTIGGLALQSTYWVSNLTSMVRFSEAIANMCGIAAGGPTSSGGVPVDTLIEIGPHSALEGPVKQTIKSRLTKEPAVEYASCLVRNKNAVETCLQLAAQLCMQGYPLNYEAVNFPFGSEGIKGLTDMVPYPWQHGTRYWHETRMSRDHQSRKSSRHDLLGTLVDNTMELESEWRNILRVSELPWLEHHIVKSNCVFPMTGYVALGLEAAKQRATARNLTYDSFVLQDFAISHPLVIYPTAEVEMRTTIRPQKAGTNTTSAIWEDFQVLSWTSRTGWLKHCQGSIGVRQSSNTNPVEGDMALQNRSTSDETNEDTYLQACDTQIDIPDVYKALVAKGAAFGVSFQGLKSCRASSKHAISEVDIADTISMMPERYESDYIVHPSTLDSITQGMWPILGAGRTGLHNMRLPSSFGSMIISKDTDRLPGTSFRVYCAGPECKPIKDPIGFSFVATPPQNAAQPVIKIDGYMMSPFEDSLTENLPSFDNDLCYMVDWEPVGPVDSENPSSKPHNLPDANVPRSSLSTSLCPDVSVIVHEDSDKMQDIKTKTLVDAIEQCAGKRPTVDTLGMGYLEGKTVIVLIELERPCLASMLPTMFELLQGLIRKASGIIWATQLGYKDSRSPDVNMITGFARTVRSESALKFVTVDLDLHPSDPAVTAKVIAEVYRRSFVDDFVEMEYMERKGNLYVPRIAPDLPLSDFVRCNMDLVPLRSHNQKFFQIGRHLKISIAQPGSLETLHFIDADSFYGPLGAQDIEIEVKAMSLNFKDVVIAMGQLPGGQLGQECSGIVTAVGSLTTHMKVGDRVCAFTSGCLTSMIRCKATSAMRVPNDMSFEVAATLPIVYCTAYYSLLDIGRLRQGEKVLIHAAAGGVGQAAIGLAHMVGAEVFATVGSASKKTFLMEKYGLQEDHIFYSRDTSFKIGIMRMTNNEGVDVVLNSLAGEALHATLECLTAFGRFIEIGKRDITDNTRLMMAPFARNIVFASVDLTIVAAQRPQLMQALLNNVLELYCSGRLQLVSPLTTFPITEVESAIRTLQGGKSTGKIVIVPGMDDHVKASPPRIPSKLLHAHATYIIIGGTGGIGRSLAAWMVDKGARHIVLVSRSGSNAKVQELMNKMKAYDARIVVEKCDVGDKLDVAALTERTRIEMPPIKGLIHSAMVLHDTLFENLAYDQYQSVIRPKVAGVWNLHHSLSELSLDFFITLSSASGIVGNKGQAAYAAANAFLDAFAQYRRSQGLQATAIDLGAVKDIGYLAENEEKAALVRQTLGDSAVSEEELHVLVAAAIMGQMNESCNGHCITGLSLGPDSSMPTWMSDSKFERLRPVIADSANAPQTKEIPISQAIPQAAGLKEVQQLIQDALVTKVASVVVIPVDEIDPTRPISVYGLDSLVAIEIRNWIARELKANLQILELLSSGSMVSLSALIVKKSKIVEEVPRLKELVERFE